MKLGSLFDGSGTCPLAAQSCGITPAWASEIEPFPIAVTESRFPKMTHLGDICKLNGAEIEPVDIITFGSPCQNLSIAGNRKGLEGEESSLFLEAVRIIKEMREATDGRYPQIAMWENVTGAFSSNGGEDFRRVIEELCRICDLEIDVPRPAKGKWDKAGLCLGDDWSLAWRQLDAQYWGVPQRRKRIFAVLDLGGQCAGEILFKREGLRRDFKAVRKTGQASTGIIDGSSEEYDGCYAVESHPQDSRVSLARDNIVQTLAGNAGSGGGTFPSSSVLFENLRLSPPQYRESEIASTIAARDHKSPRELIAVPVCAAAGFKHKASSKAGGVGYETEKAPTLMAGQLAAVCAPVCMAAGTTRAGITEDDVSPTLLQRAGTGGG